ncbi:hypothetical protein GCM10023224_12700 [Streptomonospora halophila]|uniref:Uncharacterized protein n=1 Tax=Streptomonospora halophila TaxID=427369 RepID=A0ABP9G964_9ACTN
MGERDTGDDAAAKQREDRRSDELGQINHEDLRRYAAAAGWDAEPAARAACWPSRGRSGPAPGGAGAER